MSATRQLDPERAIDRAIAARDAGRTEDAVALLKRALKREPANARLWQTLGTVYRADEQSARAIDAFATAARLAPDDFKPAYGVAQASLEAGRPAVALFDAARRLAPSEPMILQGRAAAQIAEGRWADAVSGLADVLESNPLWLDGLKTLTRLLWAAGEDVFDRPFAEAVARAPGQPGIWQSWIETLIHGEHYERARHVIALAGQRFQGDGFLTPLLAITTSELGDGETADKFFAQLPVSQNLMLTERYARHLLRTGRADRIEALTAPWRGGPGEMWLSPYLSLAWRVLGDSRWQWLDAPELIGEYDLDVDLSRLAPVLRRLHLAKRDPLGQSVRGGTQTDGPLFAREERAIRDLRAAIAQAVDRHLATFTLQADHPILRHIGRRHRFAGSWSVRLTGEGHHHSRHIHPEGWFSSAFYVAVPDQSEMGPEPNGWLELGVPPPELGLDLAPLQRIAPVPGRLVLFPSTTWHGTAPIRSGERLTVAFDVAAVGSA